MNKALTLPDFNNLETYNYPLPKELIAQHGALPRDSSKLMILDTKTGKVNHKIFHQLPQFLQKGDLLILNNTKVIPAKIFARKKTGGKIEILLIQKSSKEWHWNALIFGKKIKEGLEIEIRDNIKIDVLKRLFENRFEIKFVHPFAELSEEELIQKIGKMPTPPYIKEELKDKNRYQTIYSKKSGAIAAPTAGLHFTEKTFEDLKKIGVEVRSITLHVGIGTFKTIRCEKINEHKMEPEYFIISKKDAEVINETIEDGRRLFVVGTTTLKALESAADFGKVKPAEGFSDLFIYPPYKFKLHYAGLLTNFHLPKSTLIMLTIAFGGFEPLMNAYKIAVKENYRFFSFGDAMLILKRC